MTVDFKNVADRRSEFGSALRTKLAELASVPEKALRLTGLRPGSIIAEVLVLPSVVDDPLTDVLSAGQPIEKLRDAVSKNANDLCALAGASLEGCNVEFKDLGIATPSIRPVRVERPRPHPSSEEPEKGFNMMIIVYCAIFLLIKIAVLCCVFKKHKATKEAPAVTVETTIVAENKVTASMEEGKALDYKTPSDEIDNSSTVPPSSDKQSEPSLNGDAEHSSRPSSPRSNLSVVRALSNQNI